MTHAELSKWEEEFQNQFYDALRPVEHDILDYVHGEDIKDFIRTEIIEKLIGDVDIIIFDDVNGKVLQTTKDIQQQLKAKWLGKEEDE